MWKRKNIINLTILLSGIHLNSLKVLLVDNSSFRSSAIRFLNSRLKFGLLTWAETGEEAIRKLDQFNPNVVIVDISLPDMNGLVLINEIRKRGGTVKLILLTLNDYHEYQQFALTAGADECLLKTEFGNSIVPYLVKHFGEEILNKIIAED